MPMPGGWRSIWSCASGRAWTRRRATQARVALYVRELGSRPSRRGINVVALDSGAGLSNSTLQQRLVSVRLFYDFLVEEGVDDGQTAIDALLTRLTDIPTPAGPTPRELRRPSTSTMLPIVEFRQGGSTPTRSTRL